MPFLTTTDLTPEDRLRRLEDELARVRDSLADVQTILRGRSQMAAVDHERVLTMEAWMVETSEMMHTLAERLTAVAVVLMPPGVPLFQRSLNNTPGVPPHPEI